MPDVGHTHGLPFRSSMYKKKFRQWRFQTFRAGWDSRAIRTSAMSKRINVVQLPAEMRTRERSFRILFDHALRGFTAQLPTHYKPLTGVDGGTQARHLSLPTPDCIQIFRSSFAAGLELMNQRGKAATWGALFEKAFEQVEPILRSNYVCAPIYFFDVVMETYLMNQPGPRRLLLTHVNRMAVRIHGPNHEFAVCTNALLQAHNFNSSELLMRLAEAYTDATCNVLGPLEYYSIATRMQNMSIRARNSTANLDQPWQCLILDAEQSPHTCPTLAWNATYYYADLAYTLSSDMEKTVKILEEFPARLQKATKEDGLTVPESWVL